jgi:hypothetical protein
MREHAIDIGALAIEQMTAQIKEELRIKQELQVRSIKIVYYFALLQRRKVLTYLSLLPTIAGNCVQSAGERSPGEGRQEAETKEGRHHAPGTRCSEGQRSPPAHHPTRERGR